jgi:hypothetical protein
MARLFFCTWGMGQQRHELMASWGAHRFALHLYEL